VIDIARPQVVFSVWDKQQAFIDSQAWCRGFVAGRGAGKSMVGALDVLLKARNGESFMAVSPTYGVLEETTWPAFEQVARQLGLWVRGVKSPIPRVVFRTLDNGRADITFRSGEKPDRLRGPSKAGLWIDEAQNQVKAVFEIGTATLRNKGEMGWVTLTMTPRGRQHWTYENFYERLEDGTEQLKPDRFLVQARSNENPFLPPQYESLLIGNYTQLMADQELGGLFVDLQGLLFRREYFGPPIKIAPVDAQRVRYWDKAASHGTGCYSAGVLMARDAEGVFYVEDVIRGQWSPGERNRVMQQQAAIDADKYRGNVLVFIEQEPGSGGKESMMISIRELAGYQVHRDVVRGKRYKTVGKEQFPGEAKVVRAQPFAAQCEGLNVRLVRGRWNEDYLAELCAFPEYVHCDQVDATSGAFNMLCKYYGPIGTVLPSRDSGAPVENTAERYGVQKQANRVVTSKTNRPGQFVR
jgi:predicted phage terminase large subunit-like protein